MGESVSKLRRRCGTPVFLNNREGSMAVDVGSEEADARKAKVTAQRMMTRTEMPKCPYPHDRFHSGLY